jgi:uncharacterized protein YjbI with pentapeptide repeats
MANQEQLERLLRSVKEWNQWREKNPRIKIDLRETNLSGANLSECGFFGNYIGVDLSGANLSGANLSKANLSKANLSKANLSKAYLNGADLSGADLNGAELSEVDLNGANLCLADLSDAYLSEADLSGANLSKALLREAHLCLANLSKANLREAHLSKANLSEANLITAILNEADLSEADLSEADLSEADLSEANLITAKALDTNFTRANLTGACIEDWHINQKTIFEEVICDYIYYKFDWLIYYKFDWLLVSEAYQDRRPHDPNKIFNPGDFERLIETARETVDLIFSDGIDWKAFLESFQGLQIESENGELSIAGILKKRDGTFVIQIDAPQNTDKAELEKRFYQKYNKLLKQAKDYYQKLQLAERDIQSYQRENTNLTNIIMRQPMIYANNMGVGVNNGEIGGNSKVGGILNEAEQQNLTEIITEVQAIITPLAQTYPNNPTTQGIKAIEAIEKNPNLKQKLIEAAKKGCLEAFKKSLDNPVGAFIGGAIEGWMAK